MEILLNYNTVIKKKEKIKLKNHTTKEIDILLLRKQYISIYNWKYSVILKKFYLVKKIEAQISKKNSIYWNNKFIMIKPFELLYKTGKIIKI